jgi:C-terminal processing protease CtpA/Prc
MKCCIALLALCLATSYSHAQSTTLSPSQTLQQQAALAQASYNKHAYAEAAALLEKLSADPQITTLSDWPNDLYNLACYQALEGKPALAILTLKQFVDLGTTVPVEDIRKDPDIVSLHGDPQFQELLARMAKAEALWKDDPSIATPYKAVLTEDEKVAGLSKFWSEARFNFPFFSRLPDLDWDREYVDYLPQVRAAQTTADYYRVMQRFAATLHDGHTGVWPPDDVAFSEVGFGTQLIENKVLITAIYDPALEAKGIHVGTEIVSVDGQPVREYAESAVAPYVIGFTLQDRNTRTYGYDLLRGPRKLPVQLVIQNEQGEKISVSVHRYCEASSKCSWPGKGVPQSVDEFADNIGAKTMQDHFAAIAQTNGLIIDLRENGGGSSSNGYEILSMLTNKPFQTSREKMLDYKPAYRAWGNTPGWFNIPSELWPSDPAHYFAKPVVVLTSAATYSAAEDFVVAFDAMHRGTLVGETTGGSTGQPLIFQLPGGGGARICTKDDAYPDGRIFEGIGVPPQVKVSPTVSDIRQGRDTALERAIEILR